MGEERGGRAPESIQGLGTCAEPLILLGQQPGGGAAPGSPLGGLRTQTQPLEALGQEVKREHRAMCLMVKHLSKEMVSLCYFLLKTYVPSSSIFHF